MEKKLYRDEQRKVIGGVCAGLADYFGIDVSIIRVIFLVSLILKGAGGLIYVVLWMVLPKKWYDPYNPEVDYRVPPQQPFNPFSPFGSVPPRPGAPFANPFTDPPKKQTSSVGLIFGIILIFIGIAFLLNEFNVFLFWNIARLWPVALIIGGGAMILSRKKKQPWEEDNWHQADKTTETPEKDNDSSQQEVNDNPPTV